MSERLLVVEDRFFIAKRGLILAPSIDLGRWPPDAVEVELRFPDGRRERLTARVEVVFARPPARRPPHVLCLVDRESGQVPVGTEVWRMTAD